MVVCYTFVTVPCVCSRQASDGDDADGDDVVACYTVPCVCSRQSSDGDDADGDDVVVCYTVTTVPC